MLSRAARAAFVIFRCWAGLSLLAANGTRAAQATVGVADRVAELRREIAYHDERYFKAAAPEISDSAYDALKRELTALQNSQAGESTGGVSTTSVFDDRSDGFSHRAHRQPMLSLEKGYSRSELLGFLDRMEQRLAPDQRQGGYSIEPKYDGLALSVTYENGVLTHATTRGDGREGDDVTANALAIVNLPHRLRSHGHDAHPVSMPDTIELRGEVYIRDPDFERINEEQRAFGQPEFANPRNLAAGTLKQLDPTVVSSRQLQIVFYGYGDVVPVTSLPATQTGLHEQIRAWGLPGVHERVRVASAGEVWPEVLKWETKRAKLGFPIDGLVIKRDSIAHQRALGTSETAPRWAVAYKFTAQFVETVLRGITLQVGRTGAITPVAELMPVSIGGSVISRASLHNRGEIRARDFRIGDTVVLEKAGEVIPVLVGINLGLRPSNSVPYEFPSLCPSCCTALTSWDQSKMVFCSNDDCPARVQRRIEHFAGKSGVNIRGLGASTIEVLVRSGALKTPADLYVLANGTRLDSAADAKMPERLRVAILTSKHAELWRVINGLSIPKIGSATARQLAQRYPTLTDFAAASPESLEVYGPAIASAIRAYFAAPANRQLVSALAEAGLGNGAQSAAVTDANAAKP